MKIFMTGATSGLGIEAAVALADQGHDLYVLGRTQEKIETLIAIASKRSGTTCSNIHPIVGDLNSLKGLHEILTTFRTEHNQLDMIINNAGLWNTELKETPDGIEETFHVNLLAPYQIIKALLPLLSKSKSPVVITTASALHQGTIEFDDLEYRKNFNGFKAYRQSKLGVNLLTRLFAREHKSVSFFSQHPGVVNTNLGRQMGWIVNAFFKLMGISPKKGAENLIFLASTEPAKLKSGAYYAKKVVKKITTESYDLEMAKKLKLSLDNYLNRA